VAIVTEGSPAISARIVRRACRLPHANSPMTNGCVATWPSLSSETSVPLLWRKWSTQTEVSASSTLSGRRTAPVWQTQIAFSSAELRQSARALPRDQRFQPRADERCLFRDRRQALGLGEQSIIDVECRFHNMMMYQTCIHVNIARAR